MKTGNILYIEDNPAHAEIVSRRISEFDERLKCRVCATGKEGLEAYTGNEWDAVLVDYKLPDSNGLEIIGKILEQDPSQRVVMISSHPDERLPLSSADSGAVSFIPKEELFGDGFIDVLSDIFDAIGPDDADVTGARNGIGNGAFPAMELELQIYNTILNTMADGVVALDGQGTIMFANEAFRKIMNVNSRRLLGTNIKDYIGPESMEEFNDCFSSTMRGEGTRAEIVMLKMSEPGNTGGEDSRDGGDSERLEAMVAQRPYVSVGHPEGNGGDSDTPDRFVRGSVMVITDISKLKETQRSLEEANAKLVEADIQKTEFVGMVAHDFGTPLGAIKGFVEILLSGLNGPLNEKQMEKLSRMLASVARLNTLREETLDLTKFDLGRMDLNLELIDFCSLVRDAVEEVTPVIEEKNQDLNVDLPVDLIIECDPQRIRQAIDNYLSNASRYTREGGKIDVSTGRTRERCMVFRVTDNGRGIAEEDLEKVFQRFYRSGPRIKGSTGLGLSILSGIVEAHGGKAWCESRLGEGSSFYFELPISQSGSPR